jgi:hypothetical protein
VAGRVKRAIRDLASAPPVSQPVSQRDFDHAEAQRYELEHNRTTIEQTFPELFARWKAEKTKGSLWQTANDLWFCGNEALWSVYRDHIRDRKCLEVGSGPYGYLAPCYWIKDRTIVDPLIDEYRAYQLELTGSTFFTDDIKTYSLPAEEAVPALYGKVDGCIICQNALDHCEDPLAVLYMLSEYAAPGCYFLLWTDIWHLAGLDAGHRNITRSARAMDSLLNGLGFKVLQNGADIRNVDEYIEYGRIARKA